MALFYNKYHGYSLNLLFIVLEDSLVFGFEVSVGVHQRANFRLPIVDYSLDATGLAQYILNIH